MTEFGNDQAKEFFDDLKGIMPHHKERLKHLAHQIEHAHSIGTRKENHIASETFTKYDQKLIVHALKAIACID